MGFRPACCRKKLEALQLSSGDSLIDMPWVAIAGKKMASNGYVLLSRLPVLDASSGQITAVIETPRGSPNKYDYDESCAAFRLKRVLPEGTSFPFDFGFIPSTLGDDGDPLDVLVFLSAPAVVGCVLAVRLIGVIEARQQGEGEDWIRNDRLLAVATQGRTHAHVETLEDLRPRLLDEIEAFFSYYNKMNDKAFEPLGRGGPKTARKLVEKAAAAFRGSNDAGKDAGGRGSEKK
jgi:inorganic pyrophosphatase